MVNKKAHIEELIMKAHKVREMTSTEGWRILKEDIITNIRNMQRIWLTIDKDTKEFEETRRIALACVQMLQMVEHWETERKKAEELWLRLEFPEDSIPFDMDIDSPLVEKEMT